jgi:hypothetical protein
MKHTVKLTEEQKKKRRLRRILLLVLLLFLVIGGGLWWKSSLKRPQIASGLPEAAMEKMTDTELKKYADMKVDQSNVTIQVFPEVEVESDGRTGTLFAQNLPTNETGQTITLTDDAGEVLFKSGLLKPGYQVSKVQLDKELSEGTHKGLVTVTFYDLKEEKQVGETNVEVSIHVG